MATVQNSDKLIEELWNRANPRQFDLLLGRLLSEMGHGISAPNYRYIYAARSADEINELFHSLMHKGNVGISADKKQIIGRRNNSRSNV